MEKKDIQKLIVIFVMFLLVGIGIDLSQNASKQKNFIYRNDIGEESTEKDLAFSIEGVEGTFDYSIEVEAMRPTQELAEAYFDQAIAEIDNDFSLLSFMDRKTELPLMENYVKNKVSAKWEVVPWEVVKSDGTIVYEKIPKEGSLVNFSVKLFCGEYERIYQFSLEIPYLDKSQTEKVFDAMEDWVMSEMEQEGTDKLVLPTELLGKRIIWSQEKSNLTVRILILEGVATMVLILVTRKKKEEDEKKRMQLLDSDYPEIVGQLTLLLGAGMNIRQAWNIIATRYLDNRQNGALIEKIAYEGIVKMNHRIEEGENEKIAYEEFANEMKSASFHRLIRLLIGNLEKGAKGICTMLEQESKLAYEQRILQAKKAGEEASTRMLMPLMLMMLVVMTIVMTPAMVDFVG